MNNDRNVILAALAGLTGGLVAGLFLGSTQGVAMRNDVVERIRSGGRQLERRMKKVESHLQELEQKVVEARQQFLERVRAEGTDEADASWEVTRGDIARELPHLPRR